MKTKLLTDEVFKATFLLAPAAMAVTDLEGRLIQANQQLSKLSGYTSEELIQMSIDDLTFIADRLNDQNVCKHAVAGGLEEYSVEKRLICKNSDVVSCNINVRVVRDFNGSAVFFIKHFTDISELKKLGKVNDDRCTLLNQFVENCSLPAAIFDMDMKYMAVSNSWYAAYKLEKYSVIGKTHYEVFPDLKEEWKQSIDECLKGKSLNQEEDYFLRSDGSSHWLSWNIKPWFNSENEIGGILMYTEEVSRHVENRQKFHDLVDNFIYGIYIYQDNKFVYSNNTFNFIFGAEADCNDTCVNVNDHIYPADVKIVESFINSLLYGNEKSFRSEIRALSKDQIIYIEISGTRTIYNNRPAIIGSVRDITERKRNEQERTEAVKLLNQRFNELSLLYRISQILNREDWNLQELASSLITIIPEGFQYPAIARCAVFIDDLTVKSEDYRSDLHMISTHFLISSTENCYVRIEVAYIKGIGRNSNLAFLAEEEKLLQMIGDMFQLYMTRKLFLTQVIEEKNLSDSIINSLPGIFYIIDESGVIVRWNKELENASGYTGEEIHAMKPISFFQDLDQELMQDKIQETFVNGMAKTNVLARKKNGDLVPYYMFARRIEFEGKPVIIGTGLNVSELKETELKLKESSEKLRMLANHIEQVREEEKISIAREIHDELGQRLTVMKIELAFLISKHGMLSDEAKKKVNEAIVLLNETADLVRKIATELRPGLLDDLGLVAALQWQSSEFERRTGIKSELIADETEIRISSEIATSIFRIYQESLTNVARHSKANCVKSSLDYEEGRLILKISDNGQGFNVQETSAKKTLGLLGMEERALSIGGRFDLSSKPGSGTTIIVTAPLD